MIVKMKKITLLTLSSEREKALEQLRKTGTMHLNFGDERNGDLDELLRERSIVERALFLLSGAPGEGKPSDMNANDVVARIMEIEEEKRKLADELDFLYRERERVEPWGDFDPEDVTFIRENGIPFNLYVLTRDEYENVSDRNDVYVINEEKTSVRVAVVNGEIEGAVPVSLFERSLGSIEGRINEIHRIREDLDSELTAFGPHRDAIEKSLQELDEAVRFERAKILMEDDEELSYIQGFVPEPKVETVRAAAKRNSWALLVQEPDEEDTVPVLLKNKKPVRIISPLFDIFGTLPGYREYDISLWFLLFFTLFFAMIIGDAGYGAIFLGITLAVVLKRKSKGKPAGRELILFTVLSSAAIVWGALSGTWFGLEAIAEAVPFKYLVVEPIASFNPRSSETVKYLSLVIGAVQILLAHGWNFITEIRRKPRIRALAQLGWMVLIFGAFFLVLNLVLDPIKYPIPPFAIYLIAGGLAFVVLFSEQEGKFFKGVLKGLGGLFPTFLNSISAFADVISYIRLFAVGLATVEIAKAFNAMAAEMGSSVVGIIGAILVLLVGHGLNLVMGAMSVIVHGVRLNMLEFSGHLGMEWTGVAYTPFSGGTEEPAQAEDLRSNEQ